MDNTNDNKKEEGNKVSWQDRLMDKIQKLTNALYRVTDLYSDKEPLKWTLRDGGVEVYSKVSSFVSLKQSAMVLDDVIVSISQIINVLNVASTGLFISDLNFEILKKEYLLLRDIFESKKSELLFDRNFLVSDSLKDIKFLKDTTANGMSDTFDKGQNENVTDHAIRESDGRGQAGQIEKSDAVVHEGEIPESIKGQSITKIKVSETNVLAEKSPIEEEKIEKKESIDVIDNIAKISNIIDSTQELDRGTRIIDFLKKGGGKTITEIFAIFGSDGISTKTVQRDLFCLVKDGIIMAEGEKRWRVYSLVR